eukprot:CAMPEP_0182917744 /NCGR_PEP_ID=MMETSP0105_2-20130417/1687_1 /TAXON_ID=81532 ORGANISM="Acanthoeca-like sp., Strain 10tr" /NCGR_SAMPLE_ID=MMETSP0105_2 /ASSEMBLY_ACC=CAM_ASM_000205 /LENGTH=475 /DNA_ID=CAMNT_0025054763 /DNA_START=27 /DNA_END=1454 /DNA_ORIENTATION=+
MATAIVCAAAASVIGHAAMISPVSRNAIDRSLPQFTGGKSPDTPCTCANGFPTVHPPRPTVGSAQCWTDPGMNYNSHPDNLAIKKAESVDVCCDLCSATTNCSFFTFLKSGTCYLKAADVGRTALGDAISGGVGTKPNFPNPPNPATKGECDTGNRWGGDGQPCLWWSQGCSIGCKECATIHNTTTPITGVAPHADKIGFRTRYCNSTFNATLPKRAWTMNADVVEGSVNDSYRFNPWRAPGYAPVVDACGQAGGKFKATPIGGDSVYTTTIHGTMGDFGSRLPKGPAAANWTAGTQVEVTWGMRYNHGGGYQYRLCPADQELTEECFQKMPLDFDRTKQALVWTNGTRYSIPGVFVDEGTWPQGSTWARNPIPRVNDDNKGLANEAGCPGPSGTSGPACLQFAPPCPQDTGRLPWSTDGSGQGECSGDWTAGVISDEVIVPKDLAPGDYVLSWRWDCEETAQIWQNCADVTIVA